jgi:hypothetical protein
VPFLYEAGREYQMLAKTAAGPRAPDTRRRVNTWAPPTS